MNPDPKVCWVLEIACGSMWFVEAGFELRRFADEAARQYRFKGHKARVRKYLPA